MDQKKDKFTQILQHDLSEKTVVTLSQSSTTKATLFDIRPRSPTPGSSIPKNFFCVRGEIDILTLETIINEEFKVGQTRTFTLPTTQREVVVHRVDATIFKFQISRRESEPSFVIINISELETLKVIFPTIRMKLGK